MNISSAVLDEPRSRTRPHPLEGLGGVAWVAALLMVALATLFRGGNRSVALMALEALALVILLGWAWRALGVQGLPPALGVGRWRAASLALAAAPVWVAATQLLPWPGGGALSATPLATAHALLDSLPVVACFLVALSGSAAQVQTLLRLWLWVAVAQAALGLLQLGGFDALYFGMDGAEPVIGSYASKNTYANLLAMAVPLAVLGLWGASARQRRSSRERRSPWWGALALLTLLAAAMASTSRTGIATALLVALLALALLAPARDSAAGGRGRWSSADRLAVACGLGLLATLLHAWVDYPFRIPANAMPVSYTHLTLPTNREV